MEERESIYLIETGKIVPNPYQPRSVFDPDGLRELAESIREYGILEPLIVTKKEVHGAQGMEMHYELIAGQRRLEAAKLVGLKAVPAMVKMVSDRGKLEIALIENLQRRDLNAIEKAKGFSRLIDEFRLTQREIAYRMGKSREYIANTLRLLKLPERIQEHLSRGDISESQARLLLGIDDISVQIELLNEIVNEKLTVRDAQTRLQGKLRQLNPLPVETYEREPELNEIEQKFTEALGTKVKVQKTQSGLKLEINLYSEEELQKILSMLEFKSGLPVTPEINAPVVFPGEEAPPVSMPAKRLDLEESGKSFDF